MLPQLMSYCRFSIQSPGTQRCIYTKFNCFPFVFVWEMFEMFFVRPPGDSFTVGLANIGNATTCISSTADCSEGNFNCHQLPVETEDATLSWGPLTAANFTADYQIIAWSGAALARDSVDHPELPREVAQELTPSDIELFGRQVAANRSWLVGNYSAWVPQVCSFSCLVRFLAFCFGELSSVLAALPNVKLYQRHTETELCAVSLS